MNRRGLLGGWMDRGWMDGWMDGCMVGRIKKSMVIVCVEVRDI